MTTTPDRQAERPTAHEHSDLKGRAVVIGALGILVMVVLVALLAGFLTGASGPARRGPTDTTIAAPRRLSSDPLAERSSYEEKKRTRLESYGWVDREQGIVHVPIERAMELQAAAQDTP